MHTSATVLTIPSTIAWDQYLLDDAEKARIVTPQSIFEKTKSVARGEIDTQGVALPWSKSYANVRLRAGKVSIWSGITHHGKTAMLKQVCLHLMAAGEKVCMASLEELPEETLADMAQQMLGGDINNDEWFDVALHWATGKLWLYDQQGMVQTDRILAVMSYAAQEKGCTHFVIDSLMRLGLPADDYEQQRIFLNRVTGYAKTLNLHVHVVCHMRKQSDENDIPNIFDIRGAAAIAEQADNVFVVWRDKRPDRPVTDPSGYLVVEKQRGRPNWLGRIQLWHDRSTGQFLGNYGEKPARYV